jgi:adenylylsulfate kinase
VSDAPDSVAKPFAAAARLALRSRAMSSNITWHAGSVDQAAREAMLGHRAATVWLTGLSGSGKSTLSGIVEAELVRRRVAAYVLDGDNVRHGLCKDLGFGEKDRVENIRRVGEVSKLMTDAGLVVLTAFISPFRADRDRVRAMLGERFLEVYVATPLATCEERDAKGLYVRARRGEIKDFTGIDSPYEPPSAPDLVVGEQGGEKDANAGKIVRLLEERGIIPSR